MSFKTTVAALAMIAIVCTSGSGLYVGYVLVNSGSKNQREATIDNTGADWGAKDFERAATDGFTDTNDTGQDGTSTDPSSTQDAVIRDGVSAPVNSNSATAGSPETTDAQNTNSQRYCNGTYTIPEAVCKTLQTVKSNPTKNNPLILGSAKQTIAAMPKGTSITYYENSWFSVKSNTGSVRITAKGAIMGTQTLFATLEKKSSAWYIIDIRPASS